MRVGGRRFWHGAAVIAAVVFVSGCSDSLPSLPKVSELNPFAEKKQPLPGKRIPVMQTPDKVPGELAAADDPVSLPPVRTNDAWSQPGGDPNNAPGNLALSAAPKKMWSADIGEGSSKEGRVTASPIVAEGRVYALDAAGTVSAFSVSGGSALWRTSLKPEKETGGGSLFSLSALGGGGGNGGGFGGGVAYDNGRLYAASGFGVVAALDPSSGKKIWEKAAGGPVRASPTAVADRVYVITLEGRVICFSGTDGVELWSARGLPQQASLILNVSPAVDGDVVVAPLPSGDLLALNAADGSMLWSESLTRTRTTSEMASLSDAARPAIDHGVVFAVGHAGRMVATQARSGERLWSLNVPGTQTPWVAGDTVFVVDKSGQLMAISRSDGKIRWTANMPSAKTWSGPVLAGGALWLTASDGKLASVDPATGRVLGQQEIGDPVYIPPVVAQGRMYILTDEAKLIAFN